MIKSKTKLVSRSCYSSGVCAFDYEPCAETHPEWMPDRDIKQSKGETQHDNTQMAQVIPDCLDALIPATEPERIDMLDQPLKRTARNAPVLLSVLLASLSSAPLPAQTMTDLDGLIFEPDVIADNSKILQLASLDQRVLPMELQSMHSFEAMNHIHAQQSSIGSYEKAIRELELEKGPFAPELFEVLNSLGLHYQQQNQHEAAIVAFERAEYITRVNRGLFNLEQLPAVEGQIRSYVATGQVSEADEKQHYLLYLAEKSYGADSMELVPALIRYATWKMELYHKVVGFEASGFTFALNSEFSTEREVREQAFGHLYQAQSSYLRAINTLVEKEDWSDSRLLQLERKLIETYFLQANRENIVDNPKDYLHQQDARSATLLDKPRNDGERTLFRFGKESYMRMLGYTVKNPGGNMKDYIDALLGLGDWYVLFGRSMAGYKKYHEAYELLHSIDVDEQTITKVLRPEVPVVLPTFTPTPYTRENLQRENYRDIGYRGFIDVSFTINRNGEAGAINVLDKSEETSKSVEGRLVKYIRNSQFRPRFNGNDLERDDQVSLRYFYTY